MLDHLMRRFAVVSACVLSLSNVGNNDLSAADEQQRQWTLGDLRDVLASRLESVDAVDVKITKEATSGKGYRDYLAAQHKSRVAFIDFFGGAGSPPPPASFDVDLVSKMGLRWQSQKTGGEQYTFSEFKKGSESVSVIACNTGALWQSYYPNAFANKPQVILDDKPVRALEPIGCWLGSHGPLWTLIDTYGALREPLLPLAESLQDKPDAPTLINIISRTDKNGEEYVSVTYHPIANVFPDSKSPVHLQATIDFSPKYGMAPVSMQTTEVFRHEAGFKEIVTPRMSEIVWSDFSEVISGVWLPGKIQLDQYSSVPLPNAETGLRSPPSEAKAAKDVNRPIDPSSVSTSKYLVKSTVVTIDRPIAVNESAERPSCQMEFDSGTIVLDRTKGELFQLTGVSPAVEATLKKSIEKSSKKLVRPPPVKNGHLFWWVNGVLAVVLLAAILLRRRKSGAA